MRRRGKQKRGGDEGRELERKDRVYLQKKKGNERYGRGKEIEKERK